jgi:hypothetical protein
MLHPTIYLGHSHGLVFKKTALNIELEHGFKQAKLTFMTFQGFATSASHPKWHVLMWRGTRNL